MAKPGHLKRVIAWQEFSALRRHLCRKPERASCTPFVATWPAALTRARRLSQRL